MRNAMLQPTVPYKSPILFLQERAQELPHMSSPTLYTPAVPVPNKAQSFARMAALDEDNSDCESDGDMH